MIRQRDPQIGTVRRREQRLRPQRPQGRVIPARQRLDPGDPPRRDLHLRLKAQVDLAAIDRVMKVYRQRIERRHPRVGRGPHHTVARPRCGQRFARPVQQGRSIVGRRPRRDPDPASQHRQHLFDRERPRQRLVDRRRDRLDFRSARLCGDDELRPADPHRQRAPGHPALDRHPQPPPSRVDQRVYRRPAIGGVDQIEPRQRQQQHRDRAIGVGERGRKPAPGGARIAVMLPCRRRLAAVDHRTGPRGMACSEAQRGDQFALPRRAGEEVGRTRQIEFVDRADIAPRDHHQQRAAGRRDHPAERSDRIQSQVQRPARIDQRHRGIAVEQPLLQIVIVAEDRRLPSRRLRQPARIRRAGGTTRSAAEARRRFPCRSPSVAMTAA